MSKRTLISISGIAIALVVLGASCGKKTTTTNSSAEGGSASGGNTAVANTNNSAVVNTSTTTNTNANTVVAPATRTVTIDNMAFSPVTITVKKGDRVTWTNNDSFGHTVTGDNGGPTSATIGVGSSYSYTFNTVGTFPYHCSIHPSMTATVVVTN